MFFEDRYKISRLSRKSPLGDMYAVCEGEQLYAQPPEGWNPKIIWDGRRVVWKVRKAMLVFEHLRDAGRNICRAS